MKMENTMINEMWTDKAECIIPTEYGDFMMRVYQPLNDFEPAPIVFYKGSLQGKNDVLARVHSECITGEVFGSQKCDCGPQLDFALKSIAKENRGMVIYLRQEGRGIGLFNKVRAYELQDEGQDTIQANVLLGLPVDARTYEWAVAILHDFQISRVKMMTNNPEKIKYLKANGIDVVHRVPVETGINENNLKYLLTKRDLMSHTLKLHRVLNS